MIPLFSIAQSGYDKTVLGTWKGEISGGGLPTKKITIVITKSDYEKGRNAPSHSGVCEGYSLVNKTNKTPFKGTIIVEV